MNKNIIIIENFYSEPDSIRSLALSTNYNSGAKYNYPGFQSNKRFVNTEEAKHAFEKIINKKIDINIETFGGFRIMTESTGAVINVHVDSADWAGLVFLSPNPSNDAGLGIYKHKETGLISPPSDVEARKMGFEDALEFEQKVVHRDKANRNCWELEEYISPEYNRLALIKGHQLFHAAVKGFGHSPEDARLTHNFFFNEKID